MRKIIVTIFIIIAIANVMFRFKESSNASYDKNFIPYSIKAFDVFVYNNDTDKEYYVGNIITNYANAQVRLSDAQTLAYDFAELHHLKNWDYICYTITDYSNSVTAVK